METASPPTPPEHAPQDGDDAPGPRVIGLVADPGTPWALVRRIAGDVEDRLDDRLPQPGGWREILNTDDADYGGSGVGNGRIQAEDQSWHGRAASASLTLPPLATMVLVPA